MTELQLAMKRSVIRLDHQNNGKAETKPVDEDRFVTLVETYMYTRLLHGKLAELMRQLRGVRCRMEHWLGEQQEKVREAYLLLREDGLQFIVVQKSPRFDGELLDKLVDLELEVAQDEQFALIDVNMIALPGKPFYCVESD